MKKYLVEPKFRPTRLVAVLLIAAVAGGCSSSGTTTDDDTDMQTLIGDNNNDGVVDILDGDYNNDGAVDTIDLDFNLDSFVDADDDINGDGFNTSADFDINGDGVVDINDDTNFDGRINALDVDTSAGGGGGTNTGPCNGHGGSDPNSSNANWDDNCFVSATNSFKVSSYTRGIQRILYCRGHGGDATSIEAFADGDFGTLTKDAVEEFQTAEGLAPDGVVGEDTWGRLQAVLELLSTGTDRDAYGVNSVSCANMVQFYQTVDGASLLGWQMAQTPDSEVGVAFSVE